MALVGYANPTSGYTAFMAGTAPYWASGPDHYYNAMARQNYNTMKYLLKGKRMADVFGGGSDVRDRINFKATPNTRSYRLGQDQTSTITQGGSTILEYWKFFMSAMAWQEETMILNAGARLNSSSRKQTWKNEWNRAYQDCYQDQIDFWDNQFWATPNAANMEGVDSVDIKSIPVFINEATNGLFNPGTAGTVWTTIHGLDPTSIRVAGRYAPFAATYATNASNGFAPKNPANILYSLDIAMNRTKFEAPPINQEYFEPDTSIPDNSGFIACSNMGWALLMSLYRNSQDRWTNATDPWGMPTFHGVPLVWVTPLDTAQLYLNGDSSNVVKENAGAGAGGTASTDTLKFGPRYYGIQPRSLKMMWHEERYMEKLDPINTLEQPTRRTIYFNTFATMFCSSRREHFIISPSQSQTGIDVPTFQSGGSNFPTFS